jgi:hypothetical protein
LNFKVCDIAQWALRLDNASRREATMPEYRAYTVDDDDHFIGSTPMICADDVDAITQARQLANGHMLEIGNYPVDTTRHKC